MGNEQSQGQGPIRVTPGGGPQGWATRPVLVRPRPPGQRSAAKPTGEAAAGASAASAPAAVDAAVWGATGGEPEQFAEADAPWWLPLLPDGGSGGAAPPFDFSSFAALRPGGAAFEHAASGATPREAAALAETDDDALRARVTDAQAAAEAEAAAEAAGVTAKIASLDAAKAEMEAELSAAKREAERAAGSGNAAAAETWRVRVRRLNADLAATARARSAAVCRSVFRTCDGYRAAFGGGGVIVGVGELGDDSFDAGFEFELLPADKAHTMPAAERQVPTLRVRVGAPGAKGANGAMPRGGAKAVVRLSKLGVRGEHGTGLINLDAERVTVRAEFSLEFAARYVRGRGWAPHGGVRFDCQRLEQSVSGGLTLADTGLPLLEMPEGLLRLVLNLLLPRAVEEALQHALPPELGEYLSQAGLACRVHGSLASSGTPVAVVDANLCDERSGDAAAARALTGVADVAAARLLANALCDWRALGLPAGPEPRKAGVLGLPSGGGDAGVERGRVTLGDLSRYSARVARWGRAAENALGELWERAMRRRSSGVPPVSVAGALAAARGLARKPVRGAVTLHALSGGVNAHAALRALAAVERRRGGRDERLLAGLAAALDALAANVSSATARLSARVADGVVEGLLEDARHEGPLSLWGALPGLLTGGAWDLRRPAAHTPHPPLPLLVRAMADAAAAASDDAPVDAAAAEGMLRVEVFCPETMCAALDRTDNHADAVDKLAQTAPPAAPAAAAEAATAAEAAAAAAACDGPVAEPPAVATEDEEAEAARSDAALPSASASPTAPPAATSAETGPDARDCDGVPLTGLMVAEASGMRCALVVDMAAFAAAAARHAAAGGAASAVPAVTLSLEAPADNRGAGLDVALRCAPGARMAVSARSVAVTLRAAAAARAACRYCAGLADCLSAAGAPVPPAAAPSAVLLRAAERHLRGVNATAFVVLTASTDAAGELLLEASGAPGAGNPVTLDVTFKLADLAEEAEAVADAVVALHRSRDEIIASLPRWLRTPPAPQRRPEPLETPAELAPATAQAAAASPATVATSADAAPSAAAAAAPKPQQQGGFQLPFQNEIVGVFRGFPGGGGQR